MATYCLPSTAKLMGLAAMFPHAPQPYGELFVMRYDGSNVQQLTDNQWEDGTPAWHPTVRRGSQQP